MISKHSIHPTDQAFSQPRQLELQPNPPRIPEWLEPNQLQNCGGTQQPCLHWRRLQSATGPNATVQWPRALTLGLTHKPHAPASNRSGSANDSRPHPPACRRSTPAQSHAAILASAHKPTAASPSSPAPSTILPITQHHPPHHPAPSSPHARKLHPHSPTAPPAPPAPQRHSPTNPHQLHPTYSRLRCTTICPETGVLHAGQCLGLPARRHLRTQSWQYRKCMQGISRVSRVPS